MAKPSFSGGQLLRSMLRWFSPLLIVLALLGSWILYVVGTDNFHAVVEHEAYRAGQMNSNELVRCIRRYHIRSILNLRGPQPKCLWYQDETGAAASQNVVCRSLALSSRKSVTDEQMRELITVFGELPRPVLIHCDGGADRTALASAVYAVEFGRTPIDKAENEFSIWYGYLPFVWKKKARLRESFRAYFKTNAHPRVLAGTRNQPEK